MVNEQTINQAMAKALTKKIQRELGISKSAECEPLVRAAGGVHEKKEDRFGDTRTGWWIDDVFLGTNAQAALEAIRG